MCACEKFVNVVCATLCVCGCVPRSAEGEEGKEGQEGEEGVVGFGLSCCAEWIFAVVSLRLVRICIIFEQTNVLEQIKSSFAALSLDASIAQLASHKLKSCWTF